METMAQVPNEEQAVEVMEKAKRRQYSAAYKLKILREADACTKAGEVGALLRRAGRDPRPRGAARRGAARSGQAGRHTPPRGPALHQEPGFADLARAEVYATLLDEGRYLCSERTMYRVLAENSEVRERRNQLRHPHYSPPELLATRPNQLWSWDITKLLGPAKWTYYYLYVILDVFSRYFVGWMVAHRETAALAERLIDETCPRQQITAR